MLTNPLDGGNAILAEYHEQEIEQFAGNPHLEALPPILSREQAKERMAYFPPYHPSDRERPAHIREHMAAGLSALRIPLAVHAELESRISRLIRWGYVARNPALASFQQAIDARESALCVEGKGNDIYITGGRVRTGPRPSATGLTLLGTTGIGKTVLTEMVLGQYKQVIVHREYKGRPFTQTQIVYLRLQCPSDGSIRTLIENFFQAMDALHAPLQMETGYHREYVARSASIQRMIPSMARLAAQHGLGMLVLDEVQDLNPRGSRAILSFLVALVNTIGVPVVLAGC
jgi:Cdc6-like AAA superfamily ATPase